MFEFLQQLDVKALEERLFTMSMKQEQDISQGESYMTLMLRVMGHMCDGQFTDLQVCTGRGNPRG